MDQARQPGRRAPWTLRRPLLAAAVAVSLAGCGGGDPAATGTTQATSPSATTSTSPTDGAPSSTASPGGRPSGTASDTPSTSPSPAPTTADPAAGKPPADGTRLSACADARCEVWVKAGDTIRFNARGMGRAGVEGVKVLSVRKKQVRYDFGSATLTQPGPKGAANINGFSLRLVRIDGKRAVIRLGRPVPGAFTAQVGPGGMQVTTGSG
ncbi:hypothetical protein FH608_013815 [Nonomuraea phyllanthi]|uniref:Uncharacterized protein n=1 Tax=Nonomuraea phyllanthi TaxID=2219224 RepID=A0A5C4WNT0_9ACTN|nr:hypothetical protein [Nonomuraea phyllanthi]KAB8195417.1 hypothetical protein FH608_013815 [Nonomuraea phyllanthi]QFY10448.1 hypothetical protein GBF35_30995 [Nonomuraea phyllanthi]